VEGTSPRRLASRCSGSGWIQSEVQSAGQLYHRWSFHSLGQTYPGRAGDSRFEFVFRQLGEGHATAAPAAAAPPTASYAAGTHLEKPIGRCAGGFILLAAGVGTAGSITASPSSVCPGESVSISSNAADSLGHTLRYQWTVDGSSQSGTGSSFTYTAGASGDHRIGLHVTDPSSDNPANPVDASVITIRVKNYSRPTVSSVTANPSDLERGQTAALHANASGSECSGTLTYSWSASEGVANGSGADGQYNSSSVTFNEADRSRPQSKRVTITGNVTDSKGGSASGSTNVTVNYSAAVKHFGDIEFPKGSARVNNCAKRVLIEQLYPILAANTNYDIVLVGHIDANEAPKGKGAKGKSLDKDRVLNTAGVLSGGSGTCTALDHSRMKGVWVGTAQDAEFLPTSCTVSTEAPKERKGYEVDANEAKNRRVEIWLIPKGLALPSSAANAADLSDADLKKVGCPK